MKTENKYYKVHAWGLLFLAGCIAFIVLLNSEKPVGTIDKKTELTDTVNINQTKALQGGGEP